MNNQRQALVNDALEIARRVAEQRGEVQPTMFLILRGRVDWKSPVPLNRPGECALEAGLQGAEAGITIWSHALIDEDENDLRLTRIFAGMVNSAGEVLAAGKRQRWSDEPFWSDPSVVTELPFAATGWKN